MVFPVMMTLGMHYEGATPALLGAALGIYGLTQAVFQLPLGMASDRWGRKPIIALGLGVFAFGSIVAGMSDTIWGLLIGRALQGAGAIASATMALVGDLTSERNRTKAMAIIGVSIGVSFSLAMVLGPIIAARGGLPMIFWVSVALAAFGLMVLFLKIPTPVPSTESIQKVAPEGFGQMLTASLKDRSLLRLDLGIFVLHFILTALFVVMPSMLIDVGLDAAHHWRFYLPVMIAAFLLMLPFIYLAERKGHFKPIFLGAIVLIGVAHVILMLVSGYMAVVATLLFFFVAFNLLEATLPSLVSKVAGVSSKGTAMGVYSTSQFLGAALGGVFAGQLYTHIGPPGVFSIGIGLSIIWALAAMGMTVPTARPKN